jgi:hypothetical protein
VRQDANVQYNKSREFNEPKESPRDSSLEKSRLMFGDCQAESIHSRGLKLKSEGQEVNMEAEDIGEDKGDLEDFVIRALVLATALHL